MTRGSNRARANWLRSATMTNSFIAALTVLIGTVVGSASERSGHQPSAVWAAPEISNPTIQDDKPRADIVLGEFIILRTSQKLDCKAGLSWMSHLAESGDSEAMFELGDMYERGNCTAVDEPKALKWFQKAAESGNSAAFSSLGAAYYSRNHPDRATYENALWWLSRGAARFEARSFYFLGLMYLQGKGVRPNDQEVFILLDISAHLYPFFSEDRITAIAARDRARESLTPAEVATAGLVSGSLLEGMLEHHAQTIKNYFPREALAALRRSRR